MGEQHGIEATRGARLNVMAAFLSTGRALCAALWCTVNASLFVGFLSWLQQQVSKPLVVIVDNASVHKAKSIQWALELLRRQGITLYFLPPYSPELNRIEKLWHLTKHKWMTCKKRTAE